MISQLKRIGLCTVLFTLAACSGGKNQNANSDVFDTSSFSVPTYNTGSTNLPTNLFDTSTSQDPAASTSSTSYGPITQTANFCLSNDMYMFGSSANQGCYGSQSYVSQNQLWSAGLTMYSSLDQALAYAKSLQPQTNDPAEARQKMALAKLIIARAVRHQLRSQWGFTGWSQDQNQVYAQSDSLLRSWITQAGQSF